MQMDEENSEVRGHSFAGDFSTSITTMNTTLEEARILASRAASGALQRLTTAPTVAVLRIQSKILEATRCYLFGKEFVEIVSPVISLETDPGIRTARAVSVDVYGRRAFLNTSMNVQKFAAVAALGRVFSVSSAVREELESSLIAGRHLCEFRIIEMEMGGCDLNGLIDFCEGLVCYILTAVKEGSAQELDLLGRKLPEPSRPFRRLTFDEARSVLLGLGVVVGEDEELSCEAEEALSRELGCWIWLTRLPNGTRGFYDRLDPSDPSCLLDMDLLFPEGYGEACSGGEREYTRSGIVRQMEVTGCNPRSYPELLQLASGTLVPSAGCGFGLERLTRYICGLGSIWDATPFPKVPGGFFCS